MIHWMDTSQPLSQSPLQLLSGLINQVAMVAGRGVMYELSHMNLHSLMPAGLIPMPCAKSAGSRDLQWVPNMAPFPGDQLATQWQADYIGLFPSWKAQHFVLTGTDTLNTVLSSLDTVLWPINLPPMDLESVLFTISWHFKHHCFWSRNSLHHKTVQKWANACEIHCYYCVFCQPKRIGVTEWWKCLWKSQVQCQLEADALQV